MVTFGILENIAFILALGFLYDGAHRIHVERPHLSRGLLVGCAFGIMMLISQSSPIASIEGQNWTIGFIIIFYATLVGGGVTGVVTLMVGSLGIITAPIMLLFARLLLWGLIWGVAMGLRTRYKAKLTDYKLWELLIVYGILLIPLIMPVVFASPEYAFSADVHPYIALTFAGNGVVFLLAWMVLRRAVMIHEAQEALNRQMEYHHFLTNAISDVVLRVKFDTQGNIIHVENFLGTVTAPNLFSATNPDDVVDITSSVHPDDLKIIQQNTKILQQGEPIITEVRLAFLQPDKYLWHRIYGMPIKHPRTERITHAYLAIKDIENEKRIQTEQHAIQLERERVRILQAFMLQVDHQFRTPLSSIHTNTYLLSKVEDAEKRIRYVDNIEAQAHLLLDLVEALALLTQLEVREELTLYMIDINDIIRAVTHNFKDHVSEAVTLEVVLTDNLPRLRGSHDFLKVAVQHLIENAVRYTQQGKISIRTMSEHYKGTPHVVVKVEDTGIGMDEMVLARAFERFYRADSSQRLPGWGLGLPFVREVANHFSGEVLLTSEEGVGTCATLYLPASHLGDIAANMAKAS